LRENQGGSVSVVLPTTFAAHIAGDPEATWNEDCLACRETVSPAKCVRSIHDKARTGKGLMNAAAHTDRQSRFPWFDFQNSVVLQS